MTPQNERDDYDDDRFRPHKSQNNFFLNRVGYLWLTTGLWFVLGSVIFICFDVPRKNYFGILLLIGNGLLIGLTLVGINYMLKGYRFLLWPITIISLTGGTFFSGHSCDIGIYLLDNLEISQPSQDHVVGTLLIGFGIGYIVLILASLICTARYTTPKLARIAHRQKAD